MGLGSNSNMLENIYVSFQPFISSKLAIGREITPTQNKNIQRHFGPDRLESIIFEIID